MSISEKIINQRFLDSHVIPTCIGSVKTSSFTIYKMENGENVKQWSDGSITMSSGLVYLNWSLLNQVRKSKWKGQKVPF